MASNLFKSKKMKTDYTLKGGMFVKSKNTDKTSTYRIVNSCLEKFKLSTNKEFPVFCVPEFFEPGPLNLNFEFNNDIIGTFTRREQFMRNNSERDNNIERAEAAEIRPIYTTLVREITALPGVFTKFELDGMLVGTGGPFSSVHDWVSSRNLNDISPGSFSPTEKEIFDVMQNPRSLGALTYMSYNEPAIHLDYMHSMGQRNPLGILSPVDLNKYHSPADLLISDSAGCSTLHFDMDNLAAVNYQRFGTKVLFGLDDSKFIHSLVLI